MPRLRPRRESFAEAVAAGKTYTQAAILSGYSAKSAGCLGSLLAKEPEIMQRIEELRSTRCDLARSVIFVFLDSAGTVAGVWIPTP